MVSLVLIPGWRSSGSAPWQDRWAQRFAQAVRVQNDDRVSPLRRHWLDAVGQTILAQPGPVIVAAHGLGCIATVHLPPPVAARIQGALLVAPTDPERRSVLVDLAPVPSARLPYRNVLVASANDPLCPIRLAGAYARGWGSEFVRLPSMVQSTAESESGEWPLGEALLQSLAPGHVFTVRHRPGDPSTTSILHTEIA